MRIEPGQSSLGNSYLLLTDVNFRIQDLPVQIRRLHGIEINDRKMSDTGSREVGCRSTTQTADARNDNMRAFQSFLALFSDFWNDQLPCVSDPLRSVKHLFPFSPSTIPAPVHLDQHLIARFDGGIEDMG